MIDQFGIGKSLEIAAMTYTQVARRTGRTTQMVAGLKSGDRVVFSDHREAARVQQLCRQQGLEVRCIVIEPNRPDTLIEQGRYSGDTIFDHSWLESFYLGQLRNMHNTLYEIVERSKDPKWQDAATGAELTP